MTFALQLPFILMETKNFSAYESVVTSLLEVRSSVNKLSSSEKKAAKRLLKKTMKIIKKESR